MKSFDVKFLMTKEAARYLARNYDFSANVNEEYEIESIGAYNPNVTLVDSKGCSTPPVPAHLLGIDIELLREHLTKERESERTNDDSNLQRIYISGPISHHDLEQRRKAFKEVESMLRKQGYEPINPMENGLPDEATTSEHMKRDIEMLMTCDMIYMMRRWTHSKGCKVEFDVATAIGLPILFEESGELTKFE